MVVTYYKYQDNVYKAVGTGKLSRLCLLSDSKLSYMFDFPVNVSIKDQVDIDVVTHSYDECLYALQNTKLIAQTADITNCPICNTKVFRYDNEFYCINIDCGAPYTYGGAKALSQLYMIDHVDFDLVAFSNAFSHILQYVDVNTVSALSLLAFIIEHDVMELGAEAHKLLFSIPLSTFAMMSGCPPVIDMDILELSFLTLNDIVEITMLGPFMIQPGVFKHSSIVMKYVTNLIEVNRPTFAALASVHV